jgi:hypothetical protein
MSSQRAFISTYLDSPIIRNDRDTFYATIMDMREGGKPNGSRANLRKARDMVSLLEEADLQLLEPEFYPSFDAALSPEDFGSEVAQASELGTKVFDQASAGATKWGLPDGLGVSMAPLHGLSPAAYRWYNCHRQFRVVVDKIACANAMGARGFVKIRSGNLLWYADKYYGAVHIDGIDDWYLLTYEQILMFKDMYYSRFNVMIACNQVYRDSGLATAVEDCLSWFLKCLGIYGNKGYEIGKNIEALAKANLIRTFDPLLGAKGSYSKMLSIVREKERSLGKRDKFMADELDSILIRQERAPHAVELFGLQKLSGHPLIDPTVGGLSVIAEARAKINYKPSHVQRLRNNFCRMYVEGYVRRLSEWPKLSFPKERRNTKLYQLYSLRELKLNAGSYPLDDWTNVAFIKHHEFNYYPNFTDLMDDRSISFYRDQAAATWDTRITTRSHKRLLMEMLRRPEISVHSIVEQVRMGNIPYSWMIVSLYPKEREFKIAARMFSMMVFEMRLFFAATEANLAEFVFPNLPQQTMTLRKQEIQELFFKVTQPGQDKEVERLFLEVDLTRWNLRWHPEVIDPIGRDLEDMFGLAGVYTIIHHFFRSCMILVRVASCKPAGIEDAVPPEGPLLWYDHEVGFEGIAQKLWTCATYSMIDLGMEGFQGRYYLVGQADNQIILTTIDCLNVPERRSHVQQAASSVTEMIETECRKVGQEAKPDECLHSTAVVTYSKDVYICGVEYFTSLKAASRMFPHSASDFPTIDNSIGALSGQAIAAAEKMKQPMNAFALWCFHMALYLTHLTTMHPVETLYLSESFRSRLTLREKYGLMILPSDLGGSQIAPVTSFFYKGGADPLSKSYASLRFYQDSSPLSRKILRCLQEGKWFDKKVKLEQLLEDPYGLPLLRPVTAETSILAESKRKVKGMTKNRDIRELTTAQVDRYEEELTKLLISCRPLNPVLLSDILGWSLVGAKKIVAKMFTSTRTIQALMQGDELANPCDRILTAGTGHFLNSLERIRGAVAGEARITSIYREVKAMRQAWNVDGSTNLVGVTAYVPFDLPLAVARGPLSSAGFKCYISLTGVTDPYHSRGGQDPYLGRATIEKRADHGYKIIVSSAPERAVKKLADIATQPGLLPSFVNLVSRVAESRANVDLSQVYPMIGYTIGGTLAHRYSSRYGLRSACGLGSMSFASHCILCNDTADPISGGEQDIQIMIQEIMVCEIGIGQAAMSMDPRSVFIHLGTDAEEWEFLDDTEMSGPDTAPLPPVRLPGNIIATADTIELRRTHGPMDSYFSSPLKAVGTNMYHHMYALRRMVHKSLMRSHSALAIADKGAGVIFFKIDILELRGCGIKKVLNEMAKEVACLAIDALFSRSQDELRWTPVPLIVAVSEALSRSIYMMFSHPLFSTDPFVTQHLYPSPLSYSFSGQTLISKVRNIIARGALTMFTTSGSDIFTSPEVIFQDDTHDSMSEAVLRRLKLILYQSMLTHECIPDHIYRIVRRIVPATLRGETTEQGRLNSLYRMVVGLTGWARMQGHHNLHEHLESIYQGRSIQYCDTTAAELLRGARQVQINWTREDCLPQLTSGDCPFSNQVVPQYSTDSSSPPFSGARPEYGFDSLEYQLFTFRRLQGRVFGAESSSGYSYLPVLSRTHNRVCVLVGCGFGSGASVLIAGGSSHVYGLDLWDDLSPEQIMSGITLPPSIVSTGAGSAFTRITTSPLNTGDITSPQTASLISQYAGAGAVMVIDIPLHTGRALQMTLATLSLLPGRTEVLLRCIGTRAKYDSFLSGILSMDDQALTAPVYEEDNYLEAWILFCVGPTANPKGTRILSGSATRLSTLALVDLSFLGGGENYLYEMLLGPYCDLARHQMETDALRTSQVMAASAGDLEHRFTYRQWTEVIHALVAMDILAGPSPAEDVACRLQHDYTPTQLGETLVSVAMTAGLRRALTRVLPRLLPAQLSTAPATA